MPSPSSHKWWSTLKSAVSGVSSSLPPLVGAGGGLECESVGKADLLSDHFDSKQSRESVDLDSVPACWRQVNVTPIPKGSLSSSVANYRLISVTSVLSEAFERLVSVRLGRFMERSGALPTPSLRIGKGWVPAMHFCVCLILFKVHWRVGRRQ